MFLVSRGLAFFLSALSTLLVSRGFHELRGLLHCKLAACYPARNIPEATYKLREYAPCNPFNPRETKRTS